MTVPANLNRVDYTGTGTTGPFTVPFPFFDTSHLTVIQTDALFNQTTLTGWTATGAGGPSGAVTLAVACPVGSTLTIMRIVPLTQITSIKNQEAFYPEVHEQEMDLLAMADQQLDEAMDRTLRLPAGLSGVDMTLPKPDPGHSLVWNAAGDGLENAGGASATLQQDLADSADVAKGDEMIAVKQPFAGAVDRTQHDKNAEWVSVLDFGADPTGITDSTPEIQNALDSGKSVYIPNGIYLFSTLNVKSNTILRGESRAAILRHTGSDTAITTTYVTPEPDGRGSYIGEGWFIFESFELEVNGNFGIRIGDHRCSFSQFKSLYIRHRRDLESADPNNQFFPGSVAIDCDNGFFDSDDGTYRWVVEDCFIRGFHYCINLNEVVNAVTINRVWAIDCKTSFNLNNVNGIAINDCYIESAVKDANGISFLSKGGNVVNITNTTFELTNASGTQFAYVFSSTNWEQVKCSGCKYLITGDGNSINSRRILGNAPSNFSEIIRTYSSATYTNAPILWAPGVTSSSPFNLPNYSRFGGVPGGNGRIYLGRDGSDVNDGYIENDGAYGLKIALPGNSVVEFNVTDSLGVSHLTYRNYASGPGIGFYNGFDNVYPMGQASRRWSVVYAGTGVINTSDEREKQQIKDLTQTEKQVAVELKSKIKSFKFNDAVNEKGDKARIHFGIIAQEVKEIFEKYGLDPFSYALLCYDEWEDDGETKNRYGIRYDELLMFLISVM